MSHKILKNGLLVKAGFLILILIIISFTYLSLTSKKYSSAKYPDVFHRIISKNTIKTSKTVEDAVEEKQNKTRISDIISQIETLVDQLPGKDKRPKWPEKDFCQKYDCSFDAIIDITLRPLISPGSSTNEKTLRNAVEKLRFSTSFDNSSSFSSLLQELVHLDNKKQKLLQTMISADYQLFPQLIDVAGTVSNITHGDPVNEFPMNDPPLFLLRRPIDEICEPNTDLLVIVKSITKNFDSRTKFREAIAQAIIPENFKVSTVFTMGLPYSRTGRTIEKEFFTSELQGRAGKVLDEYMDPAKAQKYYENVLEESDSYGDIILGSYYDSYYNLTQKCITSWRWASQFCPKAKTVAVVDDDMQLNFPNIIKMINDWSPYKRSHLAAGTVWDKKKVSRPVQDNPKLNRWALDEADFPWTYFPRYFSGIASFFGPKTISKMAIGSAFVKYLDIDDSFIGMLLVKLNIPVEHISTVSYAKLKDLNPNYEAIAGFA